MDLEQLRDRIDEIDRQLVGLFRQRMDIAAEVADYKKANGLPVLDKERERALLNKIALLGGSEYADYSVRLYSQILELSKAYQHRRLDSESVLYTQIKNAVAACGSKALPDSAAVACQGVEGAYSSIACDRLFSRSDIMYVDSFEGVLSAVSSGLCRYGILPIENSTVGSVNMVYDLMRKHNFYIVRSTRIKVNHSLLAKKGTKISDIRKIYSHPMAIAQSEKFLSTLENVEVIPCENTAVAAKAVAQSEDAGVAALSSVQCAELYSLDILKNSVQDRDDNYTRFILISKELEIYPGADRTSLMLTLPHRAGSLNSLLSLFSALGINLVKLESRPLEGRDFEFMFYFDIEASVYSEKFYQLINELEYATESFSYLGSYSEIV